jgi:dTDP-4-amino-4,6-dideoxygalactose transaminase
LGKIGAFSTQSDKSINTGEGGFLVTDDDLLFERAVAFSGAYEGRVAKHLPGPAKCNHLAIPLFNFRMDELRGAVALAQLGRLPERVAKLAANYRQVCDIVSCYPELAVRRSFREESTLGDSLLLHLLVGTPQDAQWLADALVAEGISARCLGPHGGLNVRTFWTWEFMFPGMSADAIRRTLPRTASVLDRTIDIPLSPMLEPADLDDLDRALEKVMAQLRSVMEQNPMPMQRVA